MRRALVRINCRAQTWTSPVKPRASTHSLSVPHRIGQSFVLQLPVEWTNEPNSTFTCFCQFNLYLSSFSSFSSMQSDSERARPSNNFLVFFSSAFPSAYVRSHFYECRSCVSWFFTETNKWTEPKWLMPSAGVNICAECAVYAGRMKKQIINLFLVISSFGPLPLSHMFAVVSPASAWEIEQLLPPL